MQIILTKHPLYNPSVLIRLGLPHSAFTLGRSSHSMIVDGDYCIEAKMFYMDGWKPSGGVRRVPKAIALAGATIVATLRFDVPNEASGLAWARQQIGKPYDFRGAFGLLLPPNRNWQEDDSWYCYELCAQAIHQAGRKLFADVGHITGRELLGVNTQ